MACVVARFTLFLNPAREASVWTRTPPGAGWGALTRPRHVGGVAVVLLSVLGIETSVEVIVCGLEA